MKVWLYRRWLAPFGGSGRRRPDSLWWLLVVALSLGFASFFITSSVFRGLTEYLARSLVAFNGHIVIELPTDSALALERWSELTRADGLPYECPSCAFSGFRFEPSVLTYKGRFEPVSIKYVSESTWRQVYDLEWTFHKENEEKGVLLGTGLVQDLGWMPEEAAKPRLLKIEATGSVNNTFATEVQTLAIRGIFSVGVYPFDRQFVLWPLAWDDEYSKKLGIVPQGIEIRLADAETLPLILKALRDRWPDLYMTPWSEMNAPLFAAYRSEQRIFYIILSVLLLLTLINLAVYLLVRLVDRRRDIHVLQIMGLTPGSIGWVMAMFAWATLLTGYAGGVMGAAILSGFIRLGYLSLDPHVYFVSTLPLAWDGTMFWLVPCLSSIVLVFLVQSAVRLTLKHTSTEHQF
jgi:lipoprotein-releasing system permease protein